MPRRTSAHPAVDDDTRLRELLKSFLSRGGLRVSTAANAAAAREQLDALDFDLIVLDVMMPGQTGLEFAGELRKTSSVPILMLTAMGDPKDRIAGLEKGVDDYLGKPFEPRELLLRIQSVLRRGRPAGEPAGTPERVTFGPFQFDLALGELTQEGKRVPLTDAEIALLRALGAQLGEVLSRETLCKSVGGAVNERAIDVQVTRLRRKIEPDPGFPRYCARGARTGTGWSTREVSDRRAFERRAGRPAFAADPVRARADHHRGADAAAAGAGGMVVLQPARRQRDQSAGADPVRDLRLLICCAPNSPDEHKFRSSATRARPAADRAFHTERAPFDRRNISTSWRAN